jgi:hypothetical protein
LLIENPACLVSAGAFRSTKTAPTTQTAENVPAVYHGLFAVVVTNNTKMILLQRNQYFSTHKINVHVKQNRHHELILRLSLLLSLSGRWEPVVFNRGQWGHGRAVVDDGSTKNNSGQKRLTTSSTSWGMASM